MAGFWNDTNVFVTGCTGILGSWLTRELVRRGANVVGLVRDRVPRALILNTVEWDAVTAVHGAIEDLELVERALNEYEIDTVFHLAAQTIVGTAHRSLLSTFETNIQGTWCVLEACRQLQHEQEHGPVPFVRDDGKGALNSSSPTGRGSVWCSRR